MFLYAENNRHAFDDYRPQVHDSDGLMITRANGEQLWRSLNNPKVLATSFFLENAPRAFGLYQRDRDFDRYQDADAHYERRPSLRVEPIGDWGKGAVQLVEIPSNLEVNDNIVAFWVPEAPVTAGQELEYRYLLTWGDLPRDDDALARVIALRSGIGGVSGVESDGTTRKFVVDFQGGPLGNLPPDSEVTAKANISQGEIVSSAISRIDGTDIWRLALDIRPAGSDPVEMNAHLAFATQRLSETWLYQWRPDDDRR
jgi:periplasmic glucans biosynthesis protein